MQPNQWKTTGYLISTVSVCLLGFAAWPGAEKEGLIPFLVGGMATSICGMAFRWWSYQVEKKQEAGKASKDQRVGMGFSPR